MARLPILVAPDPRLKQRAEPVETVDGDVCRLMDDMLETMYDAQGIGLAAPQVGVLKRVIVVDCAGADADPKPVMLANPEVISASSETGMRKEGCLSLPQHYAEVRRSLNIRVRYLDRENEIREMAADGLLAVCIQHEIDHLEGTLFVDRIGSIRRGMIIRKLAKAKRQGELTTA